MKKTEPSLYWHDYETWGATPAIDRPAQFAGIRTNIDLEPIGMPDMWYCKPTPDVLPHPMAIKVTGITPPFAAEKGISEPEFMANVHQCLSQPGTCGVGYNSLRFDDEVTRYGLYRNFFDPYAREWQQGNSRWDIIDMTRACYALKPEGIEWPVFDGVPSFKLENLSKANGLDHGNAHDALSDVEATIGLARLIKTTHPAFYAHIFALRSKRIVAELIDVQAKKPLLHVSSKFPARNGCTALVVPLAYHPTNKNAVIVYDLSVPPDDLIRLSPEAIAEQVFTRQDALPERVQRIPLKAVHLNKCPILLTPKLLTASTAERLNIDRALAEKHWHQLLEADSSNTHQAHQQGAAQSSSLQSKIAKVFELMQFEPRPAEQNLYGAFLPQVDKPIAERVRLAGEAALSSDTFPFTDERYKTLLFHYKARHYPKTLSSEEHQSWRAFCQSRWHGDQPGFLSIKGFEQAMAELLAEDESTDLRTKLSATLDWIKAETAQ